MKFRVLLVDDHKIFREGIHKLLEQQDDINVVGEAEDGLMALNMVHKLSPNVVVMDVTMPNLNGIDATRLILAAKPDIKVIALSMHSNKHLVRGMLEVGASGYLLKECAVDELILAIRMSVNKNQIYLSPEISKTVVDQYLHPHGQNGIPSDRAALTSREREIMQFIVEGKTSKEIADIIGMSVRTVEKYRPKIMQKLGVENLAELIKYSVRKGLTSS